MENEISRWELKSSEITMEDKIGKGCFGGKSTHLQVDACSCLQRKTQVQLQKQ